MRGFRKELDSSEKLGESKGKTIPRNFTNQNIIKQERIRKQQKKRKGGELKVFDLAVGNLHYTFTHSLISLILLISKTSPSGSPRPRNDIGNQNHIFCATYRRSIANRKPLKDDLIVACFIRLVMGLLLR